MGLVSAYFLGYQINLVVPALLMGGSVVGIAYQLEKKMLGSSANRTLLLKVLFIPAGFVTAYALLEQLWIVFLLAVIFLFLVSFAFSSANKMSSSSKETADDIEKKMENCC